MKKLLLSTLVLLLLTTISQAQKSSNFTSDTIKTQTENDFTGFQLIDSVVPKFDVFINGENHTYLDGNSKLWVKMFKYLHKNAGVRNIMIEYGYASGWLINEYIQTGDTNLFNIINTYAYDQYAAAYKALMEFNQTLDSADKIYLTGIDLERGVYSASKVLSMQFPEDKEPHDSIALDVESLKSLVSYNEIKVFDPQSDFDYYNRYDVQSTINNVIKSFDSHREIYKEYLGENFALYKRILQGLKDLKVYKQYNEENSTHQFVYRERYMYKQFKKEYAEHDGKFFGQFGRCHISKNQQTTTSCNWYNFKSLANRISQGGAGSSDTLKVFTTGIFYHTGDYGEDELEGMRSHMDKLFANIEDNRLSLYDLPSDTALNSRLEDMFNYIILCTYERNREYGAPVVDIDDILLPKNGNKVVMSFSVGYHTMEMEELNSYLGNSTATEIAAASPFWAITFASKDETFGINSLGYIGAYFKQTSEINDSTSATMKGFVYKSISGFDIFQKTKWLDIVPGLGFSYHNLKLDLSRRTNNPSVLNGFLGEESVSRTNNPAILFDLVTNIGINIGHFSFGGTAGYSIDLSRPQWRAGKNLLSSGPSTSMTGMFWNVNVGFNFGT